MERITVVFVVGMLCSGAVNILTKKAQNDVDSLDSSGLVEPFTHPWFQTFVMFTGETLCLLPILVQYILYRRSLSRLAHKGGEYPTMSGDGHPPSSGPEKPSFRISYLFLFPMLCDFFGTTFGGIGLIYTAASVWQMLRGSIIIFSGVLSVIFLKRKLVLYQWTGMVIVALGLGCVGSSSLLANPSDSKNTIVGILFILLGQFCNSLQMVVEEIFLKKHQFTALNVVGMEGAYGMFVMIFFALPGLYFVPQSVTNFHENAYDALVQISHSKSLLTFILIYLCSIAVYNFCGLSVAKKLTTIHRTLVDATTTVLIWIIEIICYYAGAQDFGEGWDVWSWLEVGGFFLLFLGSSIYNRLLIIPCFYYPPIVKESEEREGEDEESKKHMVTISDSSEDRDSNSINATY